MWDMIVLAAMAQFLMILPLMGTSVQYEEPHPEVNHGFSRGSLCSYSVLILKA
jgi:hypothetical protein